jgi:hypothetical protein
MSHVHLHTTSPHHIASQHTFYPTLLTHKVLPRLYNILHHAPPPQRRKPSTACPTALTAALQDRAHTTHAFLPPTWPFHMVRVSLARHLVASRLPAVRLDLPPCTACRLIFLSPRCSVADAVVRDGHGSYDAEKRKLAGGCERVVTRAAWASRNLYQPCWRDRTLGLRVGLRWLGGRWWRFALVLLWALLFLLFTW